MVSKKKIILKKLKSKKSHFYEPGLDKDIKKIIKKGNLLFILQFQTKKISTLIS